MGSISDNSSGGYYGYRMSKASLCMAAKSLSIDLIDRSILVGVLHPGLVSTRMTSYTKDGINPKHSVQSMLPLIDKLSIEDTGSFWHANGDVLPW